MSKRYIGFDIGGGTVKMVYFSGKKLKKAVCAEIPDNIVSDGEIRAMDAMADFLRETAKKNSIPLHCNASIVIPSSLVFVRNVSFPLMSDQQIKYNLPFEFHDYLTQEKGQYIFDYSVLGTEYDDDSKTSNMRLFACAVLRSTIESYRAMFKRAGFNLKIAVPYEEALCSIMRSYVSQNNEESSRNYCIVDVGQTSIKVQVFHNSEHSVSNNIELGIKELDLTIADIYDVDIHVAHTYLSSNYMNIQYDERCVEIYRRMAVEIMRSIHFFNYNNRDAVLKDIFVCGGGAGIEPLYTELSAMIDNSGSVEEAARSLYPAQKLLADQLEEPWMYLAAYGCALIR